MFFFAPLRASFVFLCATALACLLPAFLTVHAQTSSVIGLTSVPEWGKKSDLKGVVHNTTLQDHGVAIYIFVEEAGGWWNKPLASQPVTAILADSSFSANIVTGGLDEYATRIIAFLIPLSWSPPILSGGELPSAVLSFPFALKCRPHGDRKIAWSGFEWTVKRSVGPGPLPMGPGPNIFSDRDTMVWVDDQQKLHLRIAQTGDQWHCSELICNASRGYGRYNFQLASRIDLLDPNIIAGIFTWDDSAPFASPPDPDYREIDFEFSRWAIPGNNNSQFVIQPYTVPGNINRFNMNLAGTDHSDHFFDWSADSVFFKSTWGAQTHAWTFKNLLQIPEPGNETIRINFHLLFGNPPADGKNAEFILNAFAMGAESNPNTHPAIRVFPNPFEKGCTIDVSSGREKNTTIDVLNLEGKITRTIFHGKLLGENNRIKWDGNDITGTPMPAGIYLIRITEELNIKVLKVVKL